MKETYLQQFLSDSARKAKRSEIRELLKLIARPDVISLAGGLPAPETFPVDHLAEMLPRVLKEHGASALQYGPTEGDKGLVAELAKLMADDGLPDLGPDRILVTSASQQGLDLCGRVFLAPGDTLICGLPSYLGALGAFSACGASLSGIPLDDEGMQPDLLEARLVNLRCEGVRPKMIYLVPDFQNPAGVTLSLSRREDILSIAREFDLLVLEDSPYRQLRYTGETVPSMKSLDRDGRVISLFTFSKILFPGLRLGWVVAEPEVISRLVMAKQPVDLCTSSLSQLVAREFLKSGMLTEQIALTRELYTMKRRVLLDALDREFDPAWGVTWTKPEGGLFLWLKLPESLDAADLLQMALKKDVAFVTGSAFHCDGSGRNTARLNFSFPSPEQIQEGVRRIAMSVGRLIAERPATGKKTISKDKPKFASAESGHPLDQLAWNLTLTELVE